jgi:crotonobetainyl-CoA:carnitine CoA-transferase CaiB-like acyl-CoA transferase
MTGRVKARAGDRNDWAAPQGCYRCAGDDRWAVISCGNDAEFERMANAMGHPEWTSDERFATVLARREHHDALDAAITAWTSQRDHYDVMHTLQAAGVRRPCSMARRSFDPHFARHHFDIVEQPMLGKRPIQRHLAAKFTRFAAKARSHAALLGEHNEDVLKELGYSDAEIAKLKEDAVIADKPNLPVPAHVVAMALKLPYDRYLEYGILQAIEPDYRTQLGLAD